MNPWYENLVEQCYLDHDEKCAVGHACATRDHHVFQSYIPSALKELVERGNAIIWRVRDLHQHGEDGLCAHCGMLYPCPTIKVLAPRS